MFDLLGREELGRSIECLVKGLKDLLVHSLHSDIWVVGLGFLCQVRDYLITVAVGLSLVREALWYVHNDAVAVGVVAESLSPVNEVVDVIAVLFGSFGERDHLGRVLLQAAEDATVCVVVVAHGCWLACQVANRALGE
jgi:hypothetical protein